MKCMGNKIDLEKCIENLDTFMMEYKEFQELYKLACDEKSYANDGLNRIEKLYELIPVEIIKNNLPKLYLELDSKGKKLMNILFQ